MGAAGWWQGPDPGEVRLVRPWCLPLVMGVRRSIPWRPLVGGRPGRCDGEWVGARPLADAQQGRRQLPAAAAQGGRYRAGPTAGTVGCAQAEPPAASLPLLCDGMTGGSTRPGQGRPARGPGVAGIHRVTAAARPGSWPGSFQTRHRHGRPGRGSASVTGTNDRDDRADAHELLREPREAGRCWRPTSGT